MKTNYAGINYAGLSGTNCDASNGVRYGVISQNSVSPDALDSITQDGEDLAWKEALAEAIAEAKKEAREDAIAKGEDAEDAENDVNEDDVSESLSMNWESSFSNYVYEQDGYKMTGCLDNDLFVLKSPFFTFAQFCSPCVPGAGNLNSPFESSKNQQSLNGKDYAKEAQDASFPRVYCLGHDWFDNGAPYAVFSVETGKLILAN